MTLTAAQTTYQFMVELREQELAKAKTEEEKLIILTHFCTLQDVIYERDWASWDTAA